MSLGQPGGAAVHQYNQYPTTVPNPRFMVRKDGAVFPFNMEVWNVDQHTKKQLRCVRDLPASYMAKLNALRIKSQREIVAQAEYAKQFVDNQARSLAAARERELANATHIHEIGPENVAADALLAEHIAPESLPAFDYLTASAEDLIAYARDEMFVELDPALGEDDLRREVADMLGTPLPPKQAAPASARAPRRAPPAAAAQQPAPAAAAPRGRAAVGAME